MRGYRDNAWRHKGPQEDDGDSSKRDVARARRREGKTEAADATEATNTAPIGFLDMWVSSADECETRIVVKPRPDGRTRVTFGQLKPNEPQRHATAILSRTELAAFIAALTIQMEGAAEPNVGGLHD